MKAVEHQGDTLRYLAVEPDAYDSGTRYPLVVLLHGFGSYMGDLAGLCPSIDRHGYVYLFPNAPLPTQMGYAWVPPGDSDTPMDRERAEELLNTFLAEAMERYGVGADRIILGGFSQGGMMAYLCGLAAEPFAGLAVLSAVTPDLDALMPRLAPGRERPMFVAHGTQDTMVSVAEARRMRRFLEGEGFQPEYREYAMGHEVSQEVLEDLATWVKRVLPPAQAPGTGT